jgi:hypothetical protein
MLLDTPSLADEKTTKTVKNKNKFKCTFRVCGLHATAAINVIIYYKFNDLPECQHRNKILETNEFFVSLFQSNNREQLQFDTREG